MLLVIQCVWRGSEGIHTIGTRQESVEAVKMTFENPFSHRRWCTRMFSAIDADRCGPRGLSTRRRYPWTSRGRSRVGRDAVVHRRRRNVGRLRSKVGPVHRSAQGQSSQQILSPFVVGIGEGWVLQQTSWYDCIGTTCLCRNGDYLRLGLFFEYGYRSQRLPERVRGRSVWGCFGRRLSEEVGEDG